MKNCTLFFVPRNKRTDILECQCGGFTPLLAAINSNFETTAEFLLDKGAGELVKRLHVHVCVCARPCVCVCVCVCVDRQRILHGRRHFDRLTTVHVDIPYLIDGYKIYYSCILVPWFNLAAVKEAVTSVFSTVKYYYTVGSCPLYSSILEL